MREYVGMWRHLHHSICIAIPHYLSSRVGFYEVRMPMETALLFEWVNVFGRLVLARSQPCGRRIAIAGICGPFRFLVDLSFPSYTQQTCGVAVASSTSMFVLFLGSSWHGAFSLRMAPMPGLPLLGVLREHPSYPTARAMVTHTKQSKLQCVCVCV